MISKIKYTNDVPIISEINLIIHYLGTNFIINTFFLLEWDIFSLIKIVCNV